MVTRNARRTPPIVLCDGPCGEAYPATMLTVVGRYAICKAELKGIRDFEQAQRTHELAAPGLERSNRQAMAEIVRTEGAWTASAAAVRAFFGLA